MLDKNKDAECQEAHELMRVVREHKDTGEAKEAFGKIYNKYKNDLWRLCQSVCGDDGNADLVFGATWKKILNSPIYDYNKYGVSFNTWMSKIANRAWLDIKAKAILGSDAEMPEIAVAPEDFDCDEADESISINENLLEEALHQLSEKEYDVLLTYIEYDTDQKKHVPDQIIEALKTKYQTTSVNLRKIKSRALQKVKDYIDKRR